MKKFLAWVDKHLMKIIVAFAVLCGVLYFALIVLIADHYKRDKAQQKKIDSLCTIDKQKK